MVHHARGTRGSGFSPLGLPLSAAATRRPSPTAASLWPERRLPRGLHCAADHVCHRNGAPPVSPARCRPDAAVDSPSSGPQVLSLDPAMNATGVQVNQIVRMVVDRDLFGVDNSTFSLSDGSSVVPGTSEYQQFSLMAELRPTLQLAPNTLYTAMVGPASRTTTARRSCRSSGRSPQAPTRWCRILLHPIRSVVSRTCRPRPASRSRSTRRSSASTSRA